MDPPAAGGLTPIGAARAGIIGGLRRSGTTVFWRSFRADPAFTAYDEPFNPRLTMLPAEHRKGTHQEYIDLLERDSERFWEAFALIPLSQEPRAHLTV